jgi:hypothetical protein
MSLTTAAGIAPLKVLRGSDLVRNPDIELDGLRLAH